MARIVPLIRAAALIPFVRWMVRSGRSVDRILRVADLGYFPFDDPERPIPLINAAAFLAELGRSEGPDIAFRVVSPGSISDLSTLGRVVLGSRTPREALDRVVDVLPHHCTHELISVNPHPDGVLVREGWIVSFDDETLHLVQQYFTAIVRTMVALTEAPAPVLARVELKPHPRYGLDHIRPWLGDTVRPSATGRLDIVIRRSVVDRPFASVARDRTGGQPPPEWRDLRQDGSLAASARTALSAMLEDDTAPSIDRLAAAAGLSRRTLQRLLHSEGTSFRDLFEEVRKDVALHRLTANPGRLADLSKALGYAHQATLTRAVRRWTGKAPSQLN